MRRAAAVALVAGLLAAGCLQVAEEQGTTTLPASTTTTAPTTTTTAPTTTSSTTTTTTTLPPTTTATTATTVTTTLPERPPTRVITVDAPLRVWVIGDSLAGPVGSALARLGSATGVVAVTIESLGGSGLASPSFYDWPGFVAGRLPQVAADVVVTVIGANDGQGLNDPGGWLDFGTPEWDAAYATLVGGFMDLLASGATRIYWVGLPIMAGPNYDAEIRRMNTIHQEQAALRPAVTYVEAYALFQGEDGEYAAQLPDEQGNLVTVRASDGIHYTGAGADRMARVVLAVIAAEWGFLNLLEG